MAIGGLTLENAVEVLGAGANSLAVISGLLTKMANQEDWKQRARDWIELTNSS